MSSWPTNRATSGAALVEALIMLPVLGALLAAVPLLHALLAGKQQALSQARACGFTYALDGCVDVSAACASSPQPGAAPALDPEHDVVAIARNDVRMGSDVFEDLPLLGDALATLLGDTFEARSAVAVRPSAGAHAAVEGAITLVCNERPRNVLALARDMFCRHLPLFDCGGGP